MCTLKKKFNKLWFLVRTCSTGERDEDFTAIVHQGFTHNQSGRGGLVQGGEEKVRTS